MRSQFLNAVEIDLTQAWPGSGTFDNFGTIGCQSGETVHWVKSNCQMHYTTTAARDSTYKTKRGTTNPDQLLTVH